MKKAVGNSQSSPPKASIMTKDWVLKKRRPVRKKQVRPYLLELENHLGIDLSLDQAFLELGEFGPWTMVLVDKVPLVMEVEDENTEKQVFLTLRGFLLHLEARRWVEVDHGAIPFLMNGADCMVAGIQEVDEDIKSGDLVWIRDEVHKRPLAIGRALFEGKKLKTELKGKGIKTLHWVGDDLWALE
jgi:PUA-domain protein